jgi:hypothetical protein
LFLFNGKAKYDRGNGSQNDKDNDIFELEFHWV